MAWDGKTKDDRWKIEVRSREIIQATMIIGLGAITLAFLNYLGIMKPIQGKIVLIINCKTRHYFSFIKSLRYLL